MPLTSGRAFASPRATNENSQTQDSKHGGVVSGFGDREASSDLGCRIRKRKVLKAPGDDDIVWINILGDEPSITYGAKRDDHVDFTSVTEIKFGTRIARYRQVMKASETSVEEA